MSLAAHDKSLKFLLQQEPADFFRFGLSCPTLRVLGPVESDLPARDRQVDGGYLLERDGQTEAGHVEFLRRHQSLGEVALDIGEAQIRIRRSEKIPVLSLLFDLYGSRKRPLLEERTEWVGREGSGSRVIFVRVNLRAMSAAELLETGPAGFHPLVPLTRDGAAEGPIRQAVAKIETRKELSAGKRADHLTVLRFLAEAEQVPLLLLQSLLTKEKLMQSSLYEEIFSEGEAKGEAKALLQFLAARLNRLPPEVEEILLAQARTSPKTVSLWLSEALLSLDNDVASRVLRKILST